MIEQSLYNKIVDVLPILCVDAFILHEEKILLLKRKEEPALGQWWVPGGRVLKNESLESAILRKVKDETKIQAEIIEQIGVAETIFEKKHTVNICFLLQFISGQVQLNLEHSEFKWFSINNLPENLNIELIKVIKKIKIYDRTN